MKPRSLLAASFATFITTTALGTPSTTVWAPSVGSTQGFLVPHLTFDAYFWGGTPVPFTAETDLSGPGTVPTPPVYPITTGLTMGVVPSDKVGMELGFDLVEPTKYPFLFNAKLGLTEAALGNWSPAMGVGIYGIGTERGVNDYNIVYGQMQKTFPWGGYVSLGGYYALGSTILWTNSDGAEVRGGFVGALTSPDIVIDRPWMKKILFAADVQTGKNAFGAAGFASVFCFNDTVGLLTGPVVFFDHELQPGGAEVMWTVQLDVDIPLRVRPPQTAPPAAVEE